MSDRSVLLLIASVTEGGSALHLVSPRNVLRDLSPCWEIRDSGPSWRMLIPLLRAPNPLTIPGFSRFSCAIAPMLSASVTMDGFLPLCDQPYSPLIDASPGGLLDYFETSERYAA